MRPRPFNFSTDCLMLGWQAERQGQMSCHQKKENGISLPVPGGPCSFKSNFGSNGRLTVFATLNLIKGTFLRP